MGKYTNTSMSQAAAARSGRRSLKVTALQTQTCVRLSADVREAALKRRTDFVREAFAFMDVDGSGTLTAEELTNTCSVIGLDVSSSEIQDIIHEYDSDASGHLDAEEFVQSLMAIAQTPDEEMREAWSFFDINEDGCINCDELKSGLDSVGIHLAPWELREMMEIADTDGDHVISFEEYATAYGALSWIRAQGVCGLMHRIIETWKILDTNQSGGVDLEELVAALVPMGSDEAELRQMVHACDVDGDGIVSFKEFIRAYHTDDWFKVRLISLAGKDLSDASIQQDIAYKVESQEERNEDGQQKASLTSKSMLMKRRALRRNKAVRIAINKFWKAIEFFTVSSAWVTKELYFTYHLKLRQAVFDIQDEPSEIGLAVAEEDWNEDSRQKQNPSSTKTKLMEARERHGLSACEPKPENVVAIGYGMFFDSMFELADAMVGRGEQGVVDGDVYADYIIKMRNVIMKDEINSQGDVSYSWTDEDNTFVGMGVTWGDVEEPDFENMEKAETACTQTSADNLNATPGLSRWERLAMAQEWNKPWNKSKVLITQGRITKELGQTYSVLQQMLAELGEKGNHQASSLNAKFDAFLDAASTDDELATAQKHFFDFTQMASALCQDTSMEKETNILLKGVIADVNLQSKSVSILSSLGQAGSKFRQEERRNSSAEHSVVLQNMVPDNADAEIAARAARVEAEHLDKSNAARKIQDWFLMQKYKKVRNQQKLKKYLENQAMKGVTKLMGGLTNTAPGNEAAAAAADAAAAAIVAEDAAAAAMATAVAAAEAAATAAEDSAAAAVELSPWPECTNFATSRDYSRNAAPLSKRMHMRPEILKESAKICRKLAQKMSVKGRGRCAAVCNKLSDRILNTLNNSEDIEGTNIAVGAACNMLRARGMMREAQMLADMWKARGMGAARTAVVTNLFSIGEGIGAAEAAAAAARDVRARGATLHRKRSHLQVPEKRNSLLRTGSNVQSTKDRMPRRKITPIRQRNPGSKSQIVNPSANGMRNQSSLLRRTQSDLGDTRTRSPSETFPLLPPVGQSVALPSVVPSNGVTAMACNKVQLARRTNARGMTIPLASGKQPNGLQDHDDKMVDVFMNLRSTTPILPP